MSNHKVKSTAKAVKYLAEWTLKKLPPLSVIAACDQAIWWANIVLTKNDEEPESSPAEIGLLNIVDNEKYQAYLRARQLIETYDMMAISKNEYAKMELTKAALESERRMHNIAVSNKNRFYRALMLIFAEAGIEWSDGEPPIEKLIEKLKKED